MAKLTLDLVEGGTLFFEAQKGFIEIIYKHTCGAEKKLGLLRQGDCFYLRSFLENSLNWNVMQAMPSTGEAIVEGARAAAKEVKKIMDGDEGEGDEPPPPPNKD